MKDFIDFIIARQNLYLAKESGKPWPYTDDKVFLRAKINNCFRKQDRFTKFELNEIKNLSFKEQLFRILILRHSISYNIYNILKDGEYHDIQELLDLKSVIGSGNNYIGLCIQFPVRKGHSREDEIIEHYNSVKSSYEFISNDILSCHSADEVIKILSDAYPRLGPFRIYEVYTSLTYCEDFKFTENDYLYMGPGSKDVLLKYLGTKSPGLQEAKILAEMVKKELIQQNLDLAGQNFTVRALEDSFCEFRKYISASDETKSVKIYRPEFFPKLLRYEARGIELKNFSKIQKSNFWKLSDSTSDIKIAASYILPKQCRSILDLIEKDKIFTKQELIDAAISNKDIFNTRQHMSTIINFYFDTLVDLEFFEPVNITDNSSCLSSFFG